MLGACPDPYAHPIPDHVSCRGAQSPPHQAWGRDRCRVEGGWIVLRIVRPPVREVLERLADEAPHGPRGPCGRRLILSLVVYAEVLAVPGAEVMRRCYEAFQLRPVSSALDGLGSGSSPPGVFPSMPKTRGGPGAGPPTKPRGLPDRRLGPPAAGAGYTPAIATLDGCFHERCFPELRVYALDDPGR